MASVPTMFPVACSTSAFPRVRKKHHSHKSSGDVDFNNQKLGRIGGAPGNFVEVVRSDVRIISKRLSKGLQRAAKAFRIREISKSVEDLIWLRNVEDPHASSLRFPSWPQQPYYPELLGIDLFLADLKAVEVYASYVYRLSKMWTKPLPETYDLQEVTDYFTLRPHIVALRLLEVFTAFVSAAIKYRISGINSASNKDAISKNNFGTILKETMLNLGPTFIKAGQSLSTRPDMIGSDISKALSELHDQVPPFPRAEAMKIIEEDLGSPVEAFFSCFSEEPVAAASFGQVYKASTLDGFQVAVKVQRPNLRHVVVRDIYILRLGLGLLQKIAKRKSDPRLYADELGKGLLGELDYNLEAANALEFMEVHSRFPFICLPKVVQPLTTKRVLTMEWMAGDSPSELSYVSSKESKQKLLDLVNKGVEASLIQLLETGLLHADPHPGNLRYLSSGKIGFLDFGLVCRMEKRHRFAMLASIVHIVNGDWASLVYDLTEMDIIRPGTNIQRFTMDLEDALGELEFSNGVPNIKFSLVLGKIWAIALKYHCRMPPYFILVLRSLASLEGLAVAADPTFKTFEAACPYVVQKLLVDDSLAARKILYSVVFNRRREFQWNRLALFLRVGATRNRLLSLLPSTTRASLGHSVQVTPKVDTANLVFGLLLSKNGFVLRRLLMSADGTSLIRAAVSKEASPFRQQFCMALADAMYKWMCRALAEHFNLSRLSSIVMVARESNYRRSGSSTRIASPSSEYESILRDRRLRVIFSKAIYSARKDRMLVLKFCWSSFVMFFVASALACHRLFVSLSEAYMGPSSYPSKQIAMAV
ncbi:hypothetical protein F511_01758 [Dorcoceras hygrometricum]|uniref:ABC1 atypical kinase-like domain-containing protein n=1 Tax=Dorcoceras hygrometricum TaxID=472368 RepID=A0A2Z7ASA3_9LAMI|nr:hypothetical protein F511_01758 [Dorcoceras hygrometricum]